MALCNLKSHTPRLFSGEKSKELTFKTLVLAMQFSRIAPKPMQGSRLRYVTTRELGTVVPALPSGVTPVLPSEVAEIARFLKTEQ